MLVGVVTNLEVTADKRIRKRIKKTNEEDMLRSIPAMSDTKFSHSDFPDLKRSQQQAETIKRDLDNEVRVISLVWTAT